MQTQYSRAHETACWLGESPKQRSLSHDDSGFAISFVLILSLSRYFHEPSAKHISAQTYIYKHFTK